MTLEEKIKLCSTCKNRTFSTKEGLLCNKTMAKPSFEVDCMDYDLDKDEQRKQAQFEEQLNESDKASGLLAFYINWAIPTSIVLTIILFFSTPHSLADYLYNLSFILYDVFWLTFYFYFSIYTIYAFTTKKTDAVFIGKWNLILLFVGNLLPLLTQTAGTGVFDNPSRLIYSSVWCVIFFLYLSFSGDVKDRFPKETRKLRKHNKLIVILSIVVPIFLVISGILEFAANNGMHGCLLSERKKMEIFCENTRTTLPMDVSSELSWVSIDANSTDIEFTYKYKDEFFEGVKQVLTEDYLNMFSKYQTELIKTNLVDVLHKEQDPLFVEIVSDDIYNVKFVYNTPADEYLYDIVIPNAELKQMNTDSTYKTSQESFLSLLDSFNKLLPIEYFEDCQLQKCSLSEDGTVLHYDLLLQGTNKKILSVLTQKYLTDYMTDVIQYLTDAPFTIAKMNNLNLSFDFKADCSNSWSRSVQF